jgi:hypothetical protein
LLAESIDLQTALGQPVFYDDVSRALSCSIEESMGRHVKRRELPEAIEAAARARLASVRVALEPSDSALSGSRSSGHPASAADGPQPN